MKNLTTIGRILFGLSLIAFSINPLLYSTQTAAVIPFPVAKQLVTYLSGLLLLAGGLSLILNKWVDYTMLLIALLLLVRAFTVHFLDLAEGDSSIIMTQIMNMAKDIGMAGAALFMAGLAKQGKS